MAKGGDFIIRQMSLADLELAVEWTAREGWNPGLSDAKVFYEVDPGGFFMGFLDGEAVASVSAVTYASGAAFLGYYIVAPELRGQGYGSLLGRHALEHVGQRILGLDGVVAQQENYKHYGFEYAYPSYRFEAMGGGEAPKGLLPLQQADWPQVAALDEACFFSRREEFLRAWISQPGVVSLADQEGGRLKGFGVLRPCRQGYKIGPLFAKDLAAAERIFLGLLAQAPGQEVFLDTPACNPQALTLAGNHGLEQVFETARMYKNGYPQMREDWLYGVTSFELG